MDQTSKPGRPLRPSSIGEASYSSSKLQWPDISAANQATLVELLCSTLSPIGRHRANHVEPSKGKKDRKRKRASTATETLSTLPPPAPEISSYVVVGTNNILRRLEMLSRKSKPQSTSDTTTDISPITTSEHFAAIFVVPSLISPTLNSMLPQLVYTASLNHPELPRTRLVRLPKGCEVRLCQCLGLPRVSYVGLLAGGPQTKNFEHSIRELVPELKAAWLDKNGSV